MKKILIILSLLLLSSCGDGHYWYRPYGRLFNYMPKGGTPGFELGWRHGCESGLGSQFGGAIYMTFYTWHKDVDIMTSVKTPEIIDRIRKRYPKELGSIDWNNPAEVNKNFSDYSTVFWNSHIFCRHAIVGQLQMSGMAPPNPGEDRFVPGADNLNSIYKIDGKGDARWSLW
jgi:hypothetical protein